jgi:CrcB protein
LGAWLCWLLGLWLNPLVPTLPLGTLAANPSAAT